MKFSKLVTETLQDVLSPQSLQSSSSYLSQSSLSRLSPASSLHRSNLLSAQPLSQSSLSQSLSATATPFNPKHQIIFHNSPTAPPKSQTLTASPPFRQDFSSSLKTTSDHMSSAKPTKLITSPTSASSSTDTPQSSQIQFQPPSNIPLPLLSTVTSPCTPTFPSFPTPTTHSLFSAPPSTSCHHLVPHPPSKVLPATPDSSLHVAQHVTEEVQISPAVPHVACGLMHLDLLAKTTTKLLLVCILFLLFLYNFEFLLGLLYFPREVFDIMYQDFSFGFYSLPFKFSGKVLPVILILLFFSFILYMPTRLFLSGANKKSFKSKNSVGRKCCQLKVLKVLLMHLFVTLLINKTTGSDNRHFFFNTLKNENKEEFLTYSTFCTLEQIEKKNITEATIPGFTIQSSFKQVWVILQVYSITVG